MKKFVLLLLIITMTLFGFQNVKANESLQEDVSNKLIRFHVIANSDNEKDQKLKLKVKDNVIRYIQPKLKQCKSIEESRKVLLQNNKNIIQLAKDTIKSEGYEYKVKSTLSRENFPIKTYGNITLPAGNYQAYRIVIGEGKGRNWWCVMFPPLCFIDVTKGEVSYKDTEKQMKRVLSNKEYKFVDNTHKDKVVLKFKVAEIIKSLR